MTRRPGVVAALLALTLSAAGCTSGPTVERRDSPVRDSSAQAADPGTVAEATTVGSVVLPPGAEVLAAETQNGIDTYYRLVVRTDAAGAQSLRTASGVAATPARLFPPVPTVAAGPALAADAAVTRTQDTVRNAAGSQVVRTIIVDGSDPAAIYVHLELFAT